MNPRSVAWDEVAIDPSDLLGQAQQLANYLAMIKNHEANRVHNGGMVVAPTSASTQLTGAAGVTEWRVNLPEVLVTLDGVAGRVAAAADHVIHDTTNLLNAVGQSCYADIIARVVAGTFTVISVKGTAGATASIVPPSDAVVQAAAGAGIPWILLARCLITRSGDTAVTQSQDNRVRPILGVTVDTEFATLVG